MDDKRGLFGGARTRSRVSRWSWHAPDPDEDRLTPAVECEIDDRIERDQSAGLVVDFDTGRGAVVWFTAKPGVKARALRDWIAERLPSSWPAGDP